MRISILFTAWLLATSALSFAQENTADVAGQVAATNHTTGGGKPSTSVQAKRKISQPVVDVSNMSEEQVRAELTKLLSQRDTMRDAVKTIRFNDGSEDTREWLDEAKTKPRMDANTGRQVGSARDTGTLSIYGFGRMPISLYPNQWLDLLQFGEDIVEFIAEHVDHINEYIAKRPNATAANREVNEEAVLQLQEIYQAPLFSTTESTKGEGAEDAAGAE